MQPESLDLSAKAIEQREREAEERKRAGEAAKLDGRLKKIQTWVTGIGVVGAVVGLVLTCATTANTCQQRKLSIQQEKLTELQVETVAERRKVTVSLELTAQPAPGGGGVFVDGFSDPVERIFPCRAPTRAARERGAGRRPPAVGFPGDYNLEDVRLQGFASASVLDGGHSVGSMVRVDGHPVKSGWRVALASRHRREQ